MLFSIDLRQNRFTHKGKPIPIRLGLELTEGIDVYLTFPRCHLPTPGKKTVEWTVIASGALYWCILWPPKRRRGQFIVHLQKPPTSWVAPRYTPLIRALVDSTKGRDWLQEAQSLFTFQKLPGEKQNTLLDAASCHALQTRLPVKLTVRYANAKVEIAPESLTTIMVEFMVRLAVQLAMASGFYKDPRRIRSLRADQGLSWWVGTTAAVAHYIVMKEMRKGRPSPDLFLVLQEVSQLEGFQKLQFGQDRRRGFVAYLVVRALQGARGLRGLQSVAPLVRTPRKFDCIDAFDATWVQPYTRKLKSHLPLFAEALRQSLLGPPGTLAQSTGLRPKSPL